MSRVIEFSSGVLNQAVNYVKTVAQAQSPAFMEQASQQAKRFSDNHVFLHVGSSSHVALPTILAGIQSGIIKNYGQIYYTLNKRNPEWALISTALRLFAEEHGVKVAERDLNAIHVKSETKLSPLNSDILDLIGELGGEGATVSLIESLAMGKPGLLPGDTARNVVNLYSDGRLGRIHLSPSAEKSVKDSVCNMGINPDWIRSELKRLGRLGRESVGFSFNWWNHDAPSYRSLGPAKKELVRRNNQWMEEFGTDFGNHVVIGQKITSSPALRAIPQGALMLASVDPECLNDLSNADQGVLNWLAAIDLEFSHPSLYREHTLAAWDQAEKTGWQKAMDRILSLEAHVPQGILLPADESDRLLQEAAGIPAGWQRHLVPMNLLDEPKGETSASTTIPNVSEATPPTADVLAEAKRVLAHFREWIEQVDPRVQRDGEDYVFEYTTPSDQALQAYRDATSNQTQIPLAQFFVQSWPAIIAAVGPHIKEAPIYSVIHDSEETHLIRRPSPAEPMTLRVKVKSDGPADGKSLTLIGEHRDRDGNLVATETTELKIGRDMRELLPLIKPLSNLEELGAQLPQLTTSITDETIASYRLASGDFNPIHESDAAAQALGLPGRILHGMWNYNLIERVLTFIESLEKPGSEASGKIKVKYSAPVRPNDQLRVFIKAGDSGKGVVTIVNQNNIKVVEATRTV